MSSPIVASLRCPSNGIVSRKSNIAYADQIKSACDTVTMDYGNRLPDADGRAHPAFARRLNGVATRLESGYAGGAAVHSVRSLCIPEI